MRRFIILTVAILCLFGAAVQARVLLRFGGSSGTAPPPACSAVCATTQSGQSFITWTDQATGATGDTWRYRVYESASAQTSGNCASGTLVADWIANNSAQLLGGNPDVAGGVTYTQAHRQDAAGEMLALSLAGTPYAAYTGIQARTIPSNRTIHYCVIAFNNTFNSGGHADTYLGTTGAVVEVAAPIQPIQRRAGISRTADPTHILNPLGTPSGIAVEWNLHASMSAGGGCSADSQYGDFWLLYGDKTMGWQDGLPVIACVVQLHSRSPNVINVFYRQTRWGTNYETPAIEYDHVGVGAIPSAETRAAYSADANPHIYPFDTARLKYLWDWTKANYNVGANNWVLYGQSLGGWGTAQIGVREYPAYFALCVALMPRFRFYDDAASSGWPTISSSTPFGANIGTNAAAVTLPDGTAWGGTGGWTDLPTYIQSATVDLCPMLFSIGTSDGFSKFVNVVAASDAYEAGKQFHAFAWNQGNHGEGATPIFALWKQMNAVSGGAQNRAWAYDEAWFRTNVALPVFSSASFNDDPNTVAVGCRNCGWQWTNTADTPSHIAFSFQNNWMANSPGTIGSGVNLQPSGPQSGPFTTATADITIGRRAQNWNPSNGTGITCTNTPNGGSPSVQSLTADAAGIVTFVGAIVNSSGAGTMDCTIP